MAFAAPPPRLRVVVADDHHHVLPEIHLALRRRVLPFTGVHIVHWDAHPDLSFSPSAACVFTPDELYDALDASAAGIAEFLLPLVFAGHVDRVTWIKPPWATQMTSGEIHGVAIGRHQEYDRLALTCPWSHFIDDDLYAPESALDPATIKRWDLVVTEAPLSVYPKSPWVLDIDLDYFSTWNPFRHDLAALCSPTELDLLTRVFTLPRYKLLSSLLTPKVRSHERQAFLHVMHRIQQFDSSQLQQNALELIDALASLYDQDVDIKVSLEAFFAFLVRANDETRACVWNAAPCLDLPHHESTDEDLDALFHTFQAFVESVQASNPPALVTIATSVSDRFLPPRQLEVVKTKVLGILEATFGPLQIDVIEYEETGAS